MRRAEVGGQPASPKWIVAHSEDDGRQHNKGAHLVIVAQNGVHLGHRFGVHRLDYQLLVVRHEQTRHAFARRLGGDRLRLVVGQRSLQVQSALVRAAPQHSVSRTRTDKRTVRARRAAVLESVQCVGRNHLVVLEHHGERLGDLIARERLDAQALIARE
jgi:hypothetical protein